MPDKRQHRGPHPEDLAAFAANVQPRLHNAVTDLSWLLSRGYADPSSLKLVGDRYELLERQRAAVRRCACSDDALVRRRQHERPVAALAGQTLSIDGYNALTTVEAALAGGVVIVGRDGCYRDMASMHGTFRQVHETLPAAELIGDCLAAHGALGVTWLLDRPISNSGRLRAMLLDLAEQRGWSWRVELSDDPDKQLSTCDGLVASADSAILDRCVAWLNLTGAVVAARIPHAWVIQLGREFLAGQGSFPWVAPSCVS